MLDQYNQQKEQSALFQYKKGAIEDEYEVGKDLGRFFLETDWSISLSSDWMSFLRSD